VNNQGSEAHSTFTQLEYDYESSFRFGGGYRWCGCGDEIRFLYTRMESSGFLEQDGGTGITAPFLGDVLSGEDLVVRGNVEVNSYELEYAKTIPLGGGGGGCGCGGTCGSCGSCPAWDISWSGGFRAAEAEWNRTHAILSEIGELAISRESTMDFDGAGLKVGMEGRRYFFGSGWLSMYAKGDLSLLYGRLQFDTVVFEEGTEGDEITRISSTNNQIIPVTELEAGLTGQISCQCRMSAGYMLSAWHDLGLREEDPDFFVDDANILGFDGLFARLDFAY
jgi:hypothetical protein